VIRLAAVLLAVLPGVAQAAPDPPDPGQTTAGTVVSNGSEYGYLRYTPTTYAAGHAAPLLVSVHGCQTTAEQHLKSTLWNRVAEREGFVVLYPDVDAVGEAAPGPVNQCWKFEYPPGYFRDNGDAAAIADMTRRVMRELTIDSERVYIVGTSAGGLITAVEAAAYADLYAAAGLVESAGYADGPCFTNGVGTPVAASAQLAYEAMGPHARVVPRFVTGSDADLAFPASCADKALEQGLRTNNLVLGGTQGAPLSLAPAAVRERRKPGGLGYTVSTYRDPAGCMIGEKWIIHGMPHAWPGGTTDPKYGGFTDPRAPSGAEGAWRFMKRFRLADTAMPCAETPPCPARWLALRRLRGAEHARARVNGRRARVRRGRVRLPATHRTRTRVAVRGRTAAGKRFTRRRAYPGCGP
jgi:poly(hydroxyalkanoate) depolymerase family esterase